MQKITLDLRTRRKGCTSDPVYRLSEALSKGHEEIIITADPNNLPLEVISLIAKVRGYAIIEHEQGEGWLRVTVARKASSSS